MEEVATLISNCLHFAVKARNYWRNNSSWQTGEWRENLIHLVKKGRAFLSLWFVAGVCLNHGAECYKLQNKSGGGWNWVGQLWVKAPVLQGWAELGQEIIWFLVRYWSRKLLKNTTTYLWSVQGLHTNPYLHFGVLVFLQVRNALGDEMWGTL